ncbi:MAG: ABC transporter substrate-binding protein [Pseudobdellovibrionaceae bacterium]
MKYLISYILYNSILIFFTVLVKIDFSYAEKVKNKNLIFLDNSVSNDTYIPSNKEGQIESAFDLALRDLKAMYPSCHITSKKWIERANPLNIYKQSEKIKKDFDPKQTLIIGIIHSSEAMLGAKAFDKSDFVALSSGATTENLNSINNNFFTIANPVTIFIDEISKFIIYKDVKKVISLVPGNSSYAKEFSDAFSEMAKHKNIDFKQIMYNPSHVASDLLQHIELIKNSDLIFTPGFIQQSLAAVSAIEKYVPNKPVLGTPNWGRSIPDLVNIYKSLNFKNNPLFFPVSWVAGESDRSKKIENKFKLSSLMGTAIYSYDAAVIAGYFLCSHKEVNSKEFKKYLEKTDFPQFTARLYKGYSAGHLLSKVSIVEFNSEYQLKTVKMSEAKKVKK